MPPPPYRILMSVTVITTAAIALCPEPHGSSPHPSIMFRYNTLEAYPLIYALVSVGALSNEFSD
jgi:hypothetical protein